MTVFQVCDNLNIRVVMSLPARMSMQRVVFDSLAINSASLLLNLSKVASDFYLFLVVVKVPIVNHLEFLRDEELEERREKRRKQLAEEETKIIDKGKEDKENRDQSAQVR
jgi:hypothetical protein